MPERLMTSSPQSIWDPMTKLKLTTFNKLTMKTAIRVGDKVIKLREERDLFARFLIITTSLPGLLPKLENTIGDYECSSLMPRLYVSNEEVHKDCNPKTAAK